MEPINFRKFEVSTKTFIAYSNLTLDVEEIFKNRVLPITPYTPLQKKRGRKKTVQVVDPVENLKSGSITRVQYRNESYGTQKPVKKESTKFFRNSITITMFIDKFINFKTSKRGKFQLTGCKTVEQADKCILYFWGYIIDHPKTYSLPPNEEHLSIYYDPVMYNVDFSLNFKVNREKLDILINTETPYTSLLETTFGYTGVNIKFPVKPPKPDFKIKYRKYCEGSKSEYIPYSEFLQIIKPKKRPRYNTFLVFQSGKVIMSGKTLEFMEDAYYDFFDIIKKSNGIIIEELS